MKTLSTKDKNPDGEWNIQSRKSLESGVYPQNGAADFRAEALHRTIGNRGMQDLLDSGAVRPRLAVSQPDDIFEQEAEKVAERVMRMPDPSARLEATQAGGAFSDVKNREARPPEPEIIPTAIRDQQAEKPLQLNELQGRNSVVTPEVESRIENLAGEGRPLPDSVRSYFEPRFGYDFSQVRVHSDPEASESALAINARAYTMGRNVVFGQGEYSPETETGKRLLAHELTHVMQQGGSGIQGRAARQTPTPSPPAPTAAQTATAAISAFRSRSSPQAFPKLSRSTVADELQQRVANPALINQKGLYLCGPAAFAYVWAEKDIVAYVNFAISLFETGKGKIGSRNIAPDNDLKSKSPGSYTWLAGLKPAEADWIVLSSIRDSENLLIDFEGGPTETTSGGTPEGEVVKWLRELGFKKVEDDVDRLFGDTVDDAKKVNAKVGPGNYILLCVDAHMINPNMKKKGEGNHYVVLVGSMTFSNGNVSFRAWTWGRYYDVSVTEEKFNSTYYGAIIALK